MPYTQGKRFMGESVRRGSAERILFQVSSSMDIKTNEGTIIFLYSEKTVQNLQVAEQSIKKLQESGE